MSAAHQWAAAHRLRTAALGFQLQTTVLIDFYIYVISIFGLDGPLLVLVGP